MKMLALALAASGALALGAISPAAASFESSQAKEVAGRVSSLGRGRRVDERAGLGRVPARDDRRHRRGTGTRGAEDVGRATR